MTEADIRTRLAANIAYFRRQMNMTQAELSERIHYSDKSVSKWERGDGTPDVCVLCRLAEVFGITVDDLLSAHPPRHKKSLRHQRVIVTLLATGLVWLCASIAFFFCALFVPESGKNGLCYIIALPASGVVLTVFSSLWWNYFAQFLSVSLIEWGLALTLRLSFSLPRMGLIFVLCGVLEIITLLWYVLRLLRRRARQA